MIKLSDYLKKPWWVDLRSAVLWHVVGITGLNPSKVADRLDGLSDEEFKKLAIQLLSDFLMVKFFDEGESNVQV